MSIALQCTCPNSKERIAKIFQKLSQEKCPSFRSYLGLWVHKTISCLRYKVVWYLLFVIFVLIFNLQRYFSHFCLSIQMLHGTFHLNGNMVEVTRNGKIPLFQIHYGFIEVIKFLIVFSYHQKNNLRTCLARSFEEVLPRKLQLNGKWLSENKSYCNYWN